MWAFPLLPLVLLPKIRPVLRSSGKSKSRVRALVKDSFPAKSRRKCIESNRCSERAQNNRTLNLIPLHSGICSGCLAGWGEGSQEHEKIFERDSFTENAVLMREEMGVGGISSSNWRRIKIIKGFLMCSKKYKPENVPISSEMKRDTCSAAVRNHQRLRVRCSSGTVLCLYRSQSSPAPDPIRSTTTFMSSYNYPHFENEESDVPSDQHPPQDPMSWGSMGQNFNPLHSKVKWGEESFHRGDRALLETVKGWEGSGGWEASFIHFRGIHQHLTTGPGYYTQIFSSWEYQKYWTVAFLADKREL